MPPFPPGHPRPWPDRKYRTYYLHPYVASYSSQEELEEAIEDAAERIEAGELPEITAPLYETAPPKRQDQQLRAVRAAG